MGLRTLSIVALFFIVLGLALCRSVGDLDIYTQIRLGQEILRQWQIFQTEILSYPLFGSPTKPTGWLAQVVFASLYDVIGFRGLTIFSSLCFITAGLVTSGLSRSSGYGRHLALVLTFLVINTSIAARPQAIAALCFSLVYLESISRASIFRSLLCCAVIALVWQNSHPSLVLGVGLMLLLALGSLVSRDSSFQSRRFFAIALVLAAFQIATPEGLSVFESSSENLKISRDLLHVSEWMPPWDTTVFSAMHMFWCSVLISLGCFVFKRRDNKASELIVFFGFLALALYSARFVLFYALACAPIWTRSFDSCIRIKGERPVRYSSVLLMLAGWVPFLAIIFRDPVATDGIPFNAIESLKAKLVSGRIYNYREWAGPLHLFGSHSWQLAIDGRLYLYSPEQWNDYQAVSDGRVDLNHLVARDRIDAFVIRTDYQRGLQQLLQESENWQLFAEDSNTQVYLPKSAKNPLEDLRH